MFTNSPMRYKRARYHAFTVALLLCVVCVLTQLLASPGLLAAQSFVRVSDIQGSGTDSPLAGRWVDTFGIVTALTQDGFYLQDPIGDGDERTSEGVYVYLNRRPAVGVGECVLLTRAYVDEFYGKTELSKLKSVEPSERCRAASVSAVPIPLARLYASPQTLFEAYEGMVVQIEDLAGVVQGSTKRFDNGEAELSLIAEAAAAELAAGRVFQAQPEQNAGLIFVSTALGGDLPNLRWGDRLAISAPVASGAPGENRRTATAILDFNFEKYQLLLFPNQPIEATVQPAPQPERATATQTDEITVCSANLWALGRGSAQHPNPLDFAKEVKKRAKAIAETLFGCTIIGLQEAGSQEAAEALANELRSQYGLDYAAWAGSGYQADNPEFPLTTAFLTLQARVEVKSVEMVQSCSTTDYEVLPGEMVCPQGEFLLFDRPSLALDATVKGDWQTPYALRVISNHLKSKGGDESVNVVRRIAQAEVVAGKVQSWIDTDAQAQVIVLGDLNDYYGSRPVETLRSSVNPPLLHTYDLLPYLDRYTYVFNGASQVLDHILVSQALQPQIAEVNVLHINSNFAYPEEADLTTVIHASDHDPVLLRLRPNGATTLAGNLRFPGITVTLVNEANEVVAQQQSDDRGDVRFWNLRPGKYTVKLQTPSYLALAQNAISTDLTGGQQQLPEIVVAHESLQLLRAIFETTPALISENSHND